MNSMTASRMGESLTALFAYPALWPFTGTIVRELYLCSVVLPQFDIVEFALYYGDIIALRFTTYLIHGTVSGTIVAAAVFILNVKSYFISFIGACLVAFLQIYIAREMFNHGSDFLALGFEFLIVCEALFSSLTIWWVTRQIAGRWQKHKVTP